MSGALIGVPAFQKIFKKVLDSITVTGYPPHQILFDIDNDKDDKYEEDYKVDEDEDNKDDDENKYGNEFEDNKD